MPEGPEVTIIQKQLDNLLHQKYLRGITPISGPYATSDKQPFSTTRSVVDKFNVQSKNKTTAFQIESVNKKGKFLWFKINKLQRNNATRPTLIIGSLLGLTGHWIIANDPNQSLPPYARLKLIYADHPKSGPTYDLYFCDKLSMGKFVITDPEWLENKLKSIGPDIFDEPLEFPELSRVTPIYMQIVDQSFIGGIGNYMRSEIIEVARQSTPFDPFSSSLNDNQLKALRSAIISVSRKILNAGGSPLYSDIYGKFGKYEFQIYQKTKTSDGRPVKVYVDSDKRKFYYT
jgi:formamidopyrimidine-DNA glycosylase